MPEVLCRISGLSLTIDKSKSLDRFPHSYHCKMDFFFPTIARFFGIPG